MSKQNTLDTFDIDLEGPVPLKFELEFSRLMIFCGMNGSGKSLIKKLLWYCTYMYNTKVAYFMATGKQMSAKELNDYAQMMFDMSFSNPEEFTGTLKSVNNEGTRTAKLVIKDGKIEEFTATFPPEPSPITPIVYASAETRTFEALSKYMQMKQMIGVISTPDVNDLKKICKMYRLYDVLAFEQVIRTIKKIGPKFGDLIGAVDGKMEEFTGAFYNVEIKELELDEANACVWIGKKDGTKTKLSSLGKGEQALIMMFALTLMGG